MLVGSDRPELLAIDFLWGHTLLRLYSLQLGLAYMYESTTQRTGRFDSQLAAGGWRCGGWRWLLPPLDLGSIS